MGEFLFERGAAEVAEDAAPVENVGAAPRLRWPERCQIEFRYASLDQLLEPDHRARAVWALVERLDLSLWAARIKAVEGHVGRKATAPQLLVALWVFATLEGQGSARELARLCEKHLAYQWLCGGVTLNYHLLSDCRSGYPEEWDALLTQVVASLLNEGLATMDRVAQDGMRVRASAGAASFRRRPTLDEALEQAEAQVQALRAEGEEDPAAADRRQKGARRRAARQRVERIEAALGRLPELEAKKKPDEADRARCSTTDPEATVMKMADGGFRPAYNVQFATAVGGQAIVGVDVIASGRDAGQLAPMVEQVRGRCGVAPPQMLVDGGFAQHDQIDAVSGPEVGCTVYAPVPKPRDPKVDRHEPKSDDSAAVASWRTRMATDQAKAIYKDRAATAECVNALVRGRGLVRFLVRGLAKVRAVALWHAVAHNVMRMATLRAAA